MLNSILIRNGLSEKEAEVYLAVLEAGEINISHISKKTKIKRTSIYNVVDNLQKKGVVSILHRHGIQYVSALPPQVLIDRFKTSASMAEKILPDLLQMAYTSPIKPRVRYHQGLQGLEEVLKEFSYSKTQSMVITDYEKMPDELLKFIQKEIVPERIKRKVRTKFIVPNNKASKTMQENDESHYGDTRAIEFNEEGNPIEILLFDSSKIGFLSFPKGERFALIIDSVAIYTTLQHIFEVLWRFGSK